MWFLYFSELFKLITYSFYQKLMNCKNTHTHTHKKKYTWLFLWVCVLIYFKFYNLDSAWIAINGSSAELLIEKWAFPSPET